MLPSHAFGNPDPGIPPSPLQRSKINKELELEIELKIILFVISTFSDLLASEFMQYSWVTGSSFVLEKDFWTWKLSSSHHPLNWIPGPRTPKCWIRPAESLPTPTADSGKDLMPGTNFLMNRRGCLWAWYPLIDSSLWSCSITFQSSAWVWQPQHLTELSSATPGHGKQHLSPLIWPIWTQQQVIYLLFLVLLVQDNEWSFLCSCSLPSL